MNFWELKNHNIRDVVCFESNKEWKTETAAQIKKITKISK